MPFRRPRGKHSARRTVRDVSLAAATLLALGPVLTACAGSHESDPTVRMIPDSTTVGAWAWTATCPFTPRAGPGCAGSNPRVGPAQLSGDEWNLGDTQGNPGNVGMSIDPSGHLTVRGDLPDAAPCTDAHCIAPSANTWVRGYPSVLYGINQCNASTSSPSSPKLALPMRVGAIPPDLIGTTTYSAAPDGVTYDIAYDLWLNDSSTRAPCRTTGTVEIMVWTGYDDRALLPTTLQIGRASSPFEIDGVAHTGHSAWSVYADNVYGAGRTAPWGGTLWFVLDKADAVTHGTVQVDLSSVLAAAGSLLQRDYGWHDFESSYWLDTIPFGMEFGPASGTLTGSGSSNFSLSVSGYCLSSRTTVSAATC